MYIEITIEQKNKTQTQEVKMAGNIYHSASEEIVDCIKYRISEMEREEKEAKESHLPYQTLLRFFYDVRASINE